MLEAVCECYSAIWRTVQALEEVCVTLPMENSVGVGGSV